MTGILFFVWEHIIIWGSEGNIINGKTRLRKGIFPSRETIMISELIIIFLVTHKLLNIGILNQYPPDQIIKGNYKIIAKTPKSQE